MLVFLNSKYGLPQKYGGGLTHKTAVNGSSVERSIFGQHLIKKNLAITNFIHGQVLPDRRYCGSWRSSGAGPRWEDRKSDVTVDNIILHHMHPIFCQKYVRLDRKREYSKKHTINLIVL